MCRVYKFWGKIFVVFLMILTFNLNVKALEILTTDDIKCTKTDAYIAYEKLSEEEKSKTIAPIMCKEMVIVSKNNKYKASIFDNASTLSKFDLRNVDGKSYVTSVKDQRKTGLCWAHATASAIESNYKIKTGEDINVSELHMGYMTSYQLSDGINPFSFYKYDTTQNAIVGTDTIKDGGNYFIAGFYLASRKGLVLENENKSSLTLSDDNITDSTSGLLSDLTIKNDKNVNQIIYFNADKCIDGEDKTNLNTIKKLIATYGAVTTKINSSKFSDPVLQSDGTYSSFLNLYCKSCGGFFYNADHAATIVGWDDNYSKDNFDDNGAPAGDGAWIAKNSYGTEITQSDKTLHVGEDGYFYISYYDSLVCDDIMAVDNVTDNTSDNAYYYAWNGAPSGIKIKSDDGIYLANKYTKSSTNLEKIESITIYTYARGDKYELYYSNDINVNNGTLLASGHADYMGFKNISLKNKICVTINDFYIILKYISNNKSYIPINIFASEYSDEDALKSGNYPVEKNPKLGVSFYSIDNKTWNDTVADGVKLCTSSFGGCTKESELKKFNFYPLIYAFTNSYDYNIEISKVDNKLLNVTDGGVITLKLALDNVKTDDINFKIINSNGDDVSTKFDIKLENDTLMITAKENSIKAGDYTLNISYKELGSEYKFTVNEKDILVKEINISGNNEVIAGGKLVLEATILPDNATNKNVKWSSSDENIATVNSEGIVTGVSEGKVTIKVESTDGSNASNSINIKVIGKLNPDLINNDIDNANNVGGQTENPKTGFTAVILPLVLLLIIGLGVYRKIKDKNFFYKI